MRYLNCNVTPGAVPRAQGRADDGSVVMMGWESDATNPARGRFAIPDCDISTGGMYIDGLAIGFQPLVVRAIIPMPGQQEEGPSLNFEPVAPFPDPPTRAEAITIRTHFQGLWVESNAFSPAYLAQYGASALPYYGAAYVDFAKAGDGDQILDQLAAVGDTHVMCYCRPGGDGYDQPNQPYGTHQIVPAFDAWGHMDEYKAMVDHVISRGFKPIFIIWGEGQEGLQWVKDTFPSFVNQMREDIDRLAYGPCFVCFDGVFPGPFPNSPGNNAWSVDDMKHMIPWMRNILGSSGSLGFMFGGTGNEAYLYVEDANDYTKPWMDGLDIVGTTGGPQEAECVSLANKAGYMLKSPTFGPCQPDQGTHFLFFDSSRGPRVYLVIEYATYQTVRDPSQSWKPFCDQSRANAQALGYQAWG